MSGHAKLTIAALTGSVQFLVCAFAGLWGIAVLLGKSPIPIISAWPLLGVPAVLLVYVISKSVFRR